MALNYMRVGWEDAPSKNTPVDAANLNHMDNGILALSRAYDEDVPRLQEQVADFSSNIPTIVDEQIDNKFGNDIGDNVTAWLTEHVTPSGSAVVVDNTLTIEGAAADAKKTGDEISGLKEDLSESVGDLKSALTQIVEFSNTVSLTSGTYKYILINQNLKANTRIRIYLDESEAVQATFYNPIPFSTDTEPNIYSYTGDNEPSFEYTLTKDCTYVAVYIPAAVVISSGSATLHLEVYPVNKRLNDNEKEITDIDSFIDPLKTGVLAGSYQIALTPGTQSVKDIDYSFKKGQRISLLVSGAAGIISDGEKAFFIDVTNNTYITPYTTYNNAVEYTLPADSSKIRCVIGSAIISQSGTVTFSINILPLYDRLENLDSRLLEVESEIAPVYSDFSKFDLPSYYFASNYIQNKISQINTLAKTAVGNGDAFIFITDEHWSQNAKKSPNLIRYISENTHIRNIISGGDTGEGGSDAFCKQLSESWEGKSVHHATGNHEYYSGGTNSNLYYMMDMQNNDEIGNPQEHYYYYDNVQAKIRYIVLNSDGTSAYSADQLTWFTNALNVENGWGIIIFVHWMYMINWANNEIGVGAASAQDFIDSINNYSGNGEIIAVFQGHVHRDRITYTQTNGVPVIITTCDKYVTSESGGTYDIDVTREIGTITEQAFDVVIVNRSTKTITAVRIGGLARDGIGNEPGSEVEYRTVQWN